MHKKHIAFPAKIYLFYHLNAIILVGCREIPKQGVQFRQWATRTLCGFLIEDCGLNGPRLRKDAGQLRGQKWWRVV